MKEIIIKVDNLTETVSGLNNALYLLGQEIKAKDLGCSSSYGLSQISVEKEKERFYALKNVYEQLCEVEKCQQH